MQTRKTLPLLVIRPAIFGYSVFMSPYTGLYDIFRLTNADLSNNRSAGSNMSIGVGLGLFRSPWILRRIGICATYSIHN